MGLVLAAACSKSSDTSSGASTSASTGSSMGTTVDQACADLAQARCDKRNTCTGGAGITRSFGDMSTCLKREALGCKLGLNAPNTASNPDGTEKCAKAWTAATCADFLNGASPADCVATGTGMTGTPCAFGAQCASTYCDKDKNAKCGQCGDAPAANSECNDTFCARGQSCVEPAFTCQALGAANANCDAMTPCGPDLYCAAVGMGMSGTCKPALAANQPCGAGKGGCDSTMGLHCQAGTCQPFTYAADTQPCGPAADGSFAVCKAGRCYTANGVATGAETGTCKAFANEGQACDDVKGPECLTPARCVANKCILPDGKCM